MGWAYCVGDCVFWFLSDAVGISNDWFGFVTRCCTGLNLLVGRFDFVGFVESKRTWGDWRLLGFVLWCGF